jgi:hypothetical protein
MFGKAFFKGIYLKVEFLKTVPIALICIKLLRNICQAIVSFPNKCDESSSCSFLTFLLYF